MLSIHPIQTAQSVNLELLNQKSLYEQAVITDEIFSVKKIIRTKIRELQRELMELDGKAGVNYELWMMNYEWPVVGNDFSSLIIHN